MTDDISDGQESVQQSPNGDEQVPTTPEQSGPSASQTQGSHEAPPRQPPGPASAGRGQPPSGSSRVPQRQKSSSCKWLIPVSLCIGCLPWLILIVMAMAGLYGAGTTREFGKHIALIHIDGVITAGSGGGSLFGDRVTGSEEVVEQLEKARHNDDALAVVIRINSPGGSAAGSEEVYNAIRRVSRDGKPVYASMGDVAASGGYYIASACDKIYADKSSLTGSIGVIFETADLSKLFEKIGVNPQTITAGKYKDIGSVNRPLTPEERKLLQGVVNDTYSHFVRSVADGRKMPLDEIKKLADGRIFSGNQALKHKLVDEIGGLYEATRAAARHVGIKGEPDVVKYGEKSWFETIFGTEVSGPGIHQAVDRYLLERLLGPVGSRGHLR